MKMNKFLLGMLLFISLSVHATEYASLKKDQVNLRTGPGDRYPIMWVYQERNFPVEVLDSFEIWRQIRDKDGERGWVHQNMLKKTRFVVIEKESSLLKKAEPEASPVAIVQPGVIAKVESCPMGPYCKITVSDENNTKTGWFLRSNLWGLDKDEIVEK